MSVERHVKLFRNGRNQAVRIPREFELPGEDAIIRKEGDRLIIEVSPAQIAPRHFGEFIISKRGFSIDCRPRS